MSRKMKANSRRKPAQSRAIETVDVILEAAARVFAIRGFDGTSTNRIAQVAGLSVGSIYQYFENKEAIAQELLHRLLDRRSAEIERSFQFTHGKPAYTVVQHLITSVYDTVIADPDLSRVLMEEMPRKFRRRPIQHFKRRISNLITENLGSSDQSRFRKRGMRVEVFVIVNAVEAALHSAIFEYGKRVDKTRLIDEICDLILRYLCKT